MATYFERRRAQQGRPTGIKSAAQTAFNTVKNTITAPYTTTRDAYRREQERFQQMAAQREQQQAADRARIGEQMLPQGVLSALSADPEQDSFARQLFLGDPAAEKFISRFTPEQFNMLTKLLNFGQSTLEDPGSAFDPIAQEEIGRFYENTVPSIAERFSGLGSGAQQSSAFAQQLGRAGTDLARGLASDRGMFGQRQLQAASPLIGMGLTQPYDYAYKPQGTGAVPAFLQSFAPGVGMGLRALGGF